MGKEFDLKGVECERLLLFVFGVEGILISLGTMHYWGCRTLLLLPTSCSRAATIAPHVVSDSAGTPYLPNKLRETPGLISDSPMDHAR